MPWKRLSTALILFGLLIGLGSPLAVSAAKEKGKKAKAPSLDDQPDPVWPPPPAPAKIKWVKFIRDEYDVGSIKKSPLLDALAGKGKELLVLQRPMAVAATPDGVLFVLDFMLGVLKFDLNAKKTVNLTKAGGFATQNPVGVAADSKFVYVTDSKKNTVAVLDFDGRILRQITDPKVVDWPVGVAVDEKADLLFVVNGHGHNLLVFHRQAGKLLRTIGKRGSEPGQFNFPTYLALLPNERIAVMDSGNFRCQILSYQGKVLRTFGQLGDKPGSLFRPKGIAADSDGNLYIVDGAFQNIQVFDQEGRLLTIIGEGGRGKGQFSLPIGIACAGDQLYVADQFNKRIQVLRYFPQQKEVKPS